MLHVRLLWLLVITVTAPTVSGAEPGTEIPILTEQQKLVGAETGAWGPCSGADSRAVGAHVALFGDTALMGTQWCGAHDGNNHTPATVVFTRNEGIWSETARLRPSSYVSLHGKTLAMTDPSFEAVYVFTQTSDTWIEQARLTPSDNQKFEAGHIVLSDNVLAVRSSSDKGSVYIFHRSEDTWLEQVRLKPSSEAISFGAIALSGETLVVSGYDSTSEARLVYIFTRKGDTWIEQVKLTDSNLPEGAHLGGSLALSDGTLLVSEAGDGNAPASPGSAHVFTRSGEGWNYQTKLKSSDNMIDYGSAHHAGGSKVAFNGNTAILQSIGIRNRENPGALSFVVAAANVFTRSGESWAEQAKLTVSEGSRDDWEYGGGWEISRMASSGNTILLGVSEAGMTTGYVYNLLSITSTPPEENPNPETPEAVLSEQGSPDSGGGVFGYLLILLLGFMRAIGHKYILKHERSNC